MKNEFFYKHPVNMWIYVGKTRLFIVRSVDSKNVILFQTFFLLKVHPVDCEYVARINLNILYVLRSRILTIKVIQETRNVYIYRMSQNSSHYISNILNFTNTMWHQIVFTSGWPLSLDISKCPNTRCSKIGSHLNLVC